MKFSAATSALLLISLAGLPLCAEQERAIVSVLSPLAYGPNCWSSVALQNLGIREVAVKVEGHKGSGALVPLAGWPSLSLIVSPAQKVVLRLEVPGEESPEGWIRVIESTPDNEQSPTIAVSGQTECVDNDQLTTTSQTVAFPTCNPWFDADVKDLHGQMVLILNTANKVATANVCYSSGITAGLPQEKGVGDPISVCGKTLRLQIPPFGTMTLPVVRDGNSELSIKTSGESLVLRMLQPQNGAMKTYKVDSSVTFEQR